MQTDVDTEPEYTIHGTTERIFVDCTEKEGTKLLNSLQLQYIRASGSFDPATRLYTVELPAPMQMHEVEKVKTILAQSKHAIKDGDAQ